MVQTERILTRTPWESQDLTVQVAKELAVSQGPRRRGVSTPPKPAPTSSPPKDAWGATDALSSRGSAVPGASAWSDTETSSSDESDLALCSSANARAKTSEADPTVRVYREVCRRARVVPATFLEQHLHDEAIVMNDHGLGPEGGVAAATALRRHKSLRVLELANNDLGSGGVAAVASALAAIPQLESLDLSGNGVGREGIRKVSRALGRTSRLQRLVLARNSFLDLDSAPLAAALKENRSLLTLSLADNRFGDVAGLRFGAMLGDNKTLLELDLSRNCIRKRGGTALGQAMVANGTLVKLVLSHNGVGDDGALEFSSSLRSNGTIERLDMSGCRITAVGASGLAQALKSNGTLQHLDIGYNPIACAGVRDILSALLEANRSLRVLVIDGIPLDEETLALLQRLLAARPDLEIRYSRPGHASSVDGMREQLLALKARNARKRAPNRMRRRSSTLALELGPDGNPLRRWPSSQYDPSWSDEEKRRHGYNPDGTPRTDGAWLAGLAEYDEGWSDEKKRDMGYNPDGTQRDDTEWQNIQRMRNGSAKGLAADQFSSSSESESSEFESDDEMAKIRHHRRHLRLCTRRFSKMYPGVDDPMAVLERYVDANKLRFVDLFFQMDRDRSGSLETEEVESAIKLMDLDLSHLQLTELMTRMDLDGDGMVDYYELAEGRRIFIEKQRAKDPNWTTRHTPLPAVSEDSMPRTESINAFPY